VIWCIAFYALATIGIPLVIVKAWYIIPYWREPDGIKIAVYMHQTGELCTMDLEDYVYGVVAAEMPASFHLESLKAQAVAARTYVAGRLRSRGGKGCDRHPQADICTDPTHCQGWLSEDELLQKWGYLDYFAYKRKIAAAVNETRGIILTYDGTVIDPVYHANSGGVTENSEDVWSVRIPYLRSVRGDFEKGTLHYRDSFSFSVSELESLLGISLVERNETTEIIDGDAIRVVVQGNLSADSVEVVDQSENGHVRLIRLGEAVFTGPELRRLLSLPSARFTVEVLPDRLIITTIGYGHGVGLSQYGADAMADLGRDYSDILRHYYTGVQLAKLI